MAEKTKPSLSKKLSSKEALELAKRPEVEEVLNTRRGWWIIFTTEFQDEVTLRYLRGEKTSIIFGSISRIRGIPTSERHHSNP